ncbi:hypothetical protein AB1046_20110 [Promicromonospora sp. Populi]|uniref:hypothetical protein n=1 Tax=Promicromonospora sp. Populi TaxID=3239420 RepID=UPI0034E1E033
MIEICVAPRDESVRRDLDRSSAWRGFERDLRRVLGDLISAAQVEQFEVLDLFVGEVPPDALSALRNGSVLARDEAVELVVRMAAGHGPYCVLSASGFRIECSWDGSVYVMAPSELSARIRKGSDLQVEYREAPAPQQRVEKSVEAVADDAFWDAVSRTSADLRLVCERWAYGSLGTRWFQIGSGSLDHVVASVRPRSLVSVLLDPETRLDRLDLDEGFTALGPLSAAGEMQHREFPLGADSIDDVVSEGWRQAVGEADRWSWVAAVPDADGVLRIAWPMPEA